MSDAEGVSRRTGLIRFDANSRAVAKATSNRNAHFWAGRPRLRAKNFRSHLAAEFVMHVRTGDQSSSWLQRGNARSRASPPDLKSRGGRAGSTCLAAPKPTRAVPRRDRREGAGLRLQRVVVVRQVRPRPPGQGRQHLRGKEAARLRQVRHCFRNGLTDQRGDRAHLAVARMEL